MLVFRNQYSICSLCVVIASFQAFQIVSLIVDSPAFERSMTMLASFRTGVSSRTRVSHIIKAFKMGLPERVILGLLQVKKTKKNHKKYQMNKKSSFLFLRFLPPFFLLCSFLFLVSNLLYVHPFFLVQPEFETLDTSVCQLRDNRGRNAIA